MDVDKMCRVCMSVGSRNIFKKIAASHLAETVSSCPMSTATAPVEQTTDMSASVSSFEKLLEKLRYVTLIKIEESENLPQLLCDLCIIQLNVAYNFKRQAIATDTKMRQYIIENGFELTKSTTNHMDNDTRMKSTPTPSCSDYQHRPVFPVMPLIIKTEPLDYEILSDITVDTNTEAYNGIGGGGGGGSGSNENSLSNGIPFVPHLNQMPSAPPSMVRLNDIRLLRTANVDSDSDFINNYLPNGSLYRQSPSGSMASSYSPKAFSEPGLIVANAKGASTDSGHASAASEKSIGSKRSETIKGLTLRSHQPASDQIATTVKGRRNGDKERPNYSLVVRRKRMINPANRLRKKIKQEKLAQNLPVDNVTGRRQSRDKSKDSGNILVGLKRPAATVFGSKDKKYESTQNAKIGAKRK